MVAGQVLQQASLCACCLGVSGAGVPLLLYNWEASMVVGQVLQQVPYGCVLPHILPAVLVTVLLHGVHEVPSCSAIICKACATEASPAVLP